jgi:hypothetical protein
MIVSCEIDSLDGEAHSVFVIPHKAPRPAGEARPTTWRHKADRMIGPLCDLQLSLATA